MWNGPQVFHNAFLCVVYTRMFNMQQLSKAGYNIILFIIEVSGGETGLFGLTFKPVYIDCMCREHHSVGIVAG